MKKIALFLLLALAGFIFVGCGSGTNPADEGFTWISPMIAIDKPAYELSLWHGAHQLHRNETMEYVFRAGNDFNDIAITSEALLAGGAMPATLRIAYDGDGEHLLRVVAFAYHFFDHGRPTRLNAHTASPNPQDIIVLWQNPDNGHWFNMIQNGIGREAVTRGQQHNQLVSLRHGGEVYTFLLTRDTVQKLSEIPLYIIATAAPTREDDYERSGYSLLFTLEIPDLDNHFHGWEILAACGTMVLVGEARNPRNSTSIVTTIFPLYDWTREILGTNPAEITVRYLLESGVDLHFYSPTLQDIAAISNADLFLWVGGKSDDWVLNAMANPANAYRRHVPIMRLLSLHETLLFPIEGVIPGEIGGEDCCGGEFHDEHVWLSLPFAMRFVDRIAYEIILLDPYHADYYTANAQAYIAQLYALHTEFYEMVDRAPRDTVLMVDRFPFLYLATDYGLRFFSAFDGCFAATEISFQRQAQLVNALNAHGLDAVLIIDNRSVAQSVVQAAGREVTIITLQDFQTVSRHHIQEGLTYLEGMRHNLNALREALQ
ncbi:MAG: metal ABC transporter substrate-binding protein [Defluviitaleaceae bacterium]|nr:metal ABC transporter substrate-binding protein [Defluviitaleaceae bacterium]MCL2273313.1 metal ABC transporter substrate-binding protein [Defluviitaleaceae bacterium]